MAVLLVGHDSRHPNTITVVSAGHPNTNTVVSATVVEWRFTAEPEEAAVVELEQKQQHQAFLDRSSEIVEIFDGNYDPSEYKDQIRSREGDDVEDGDEEDDLYYFMRHGHRKTQESSSSTRV